MSTTQQVLSIDRRAAASRPRWRLWPAGVHRTDFTWAMAFAIPYVVMFVAFVVYPVGYGLWLGGKPSLYRDLFADPIYLSTVVNTVLFVGIGVNLKMALAFVLSGFFMRQRPWIRWALLIFILPWAVPALPAFLSIHWMLNGQWGLLNNALWALFGIDGPIWLNSRWLGLGSNIVAYIWKWMPFWTVIFLAGRMAIPHELYEAAEIDGATGYRRFVHVTCPLLANLYLVCTLLSTIWTLGDFTTVYFVSGGGPAMATQVLATLGIRNAFVMSEPRLGVAAVMSALPVLIPIVMLLMHKLRTAEVQL